MNCPYCGRLSGFSLGLSWFLTVARANHSIASSGRYFFFYGYYQELTSSLLQCCHLSVRHIIAYNLNTNVRNLVSLWFYLNRLRNHGKIKGFLYYGYK